MDTEAKGNNNFIYFAVAAVNLISFTSGGAFSWTSPILPKLSSIDPTINPLPRPITTFDQSWVVAIMNLGAVVGPLVGGPCSKKLGKKNTLLIIGIPMMFSHLLCAFANNIYVFLAARFLMGIGVGTAFGSVPGYVSDISEDNNRGFLGSILIQANCSGILFMFVVGPFVSIRTFSLVNIVPMALFYITFGYCVPESPYDLVRRGNQTAAEASLMRLRNKTSWQVKKELTFIIDTIEASKSIPEAGGIFTIFKNKALAKGLLISNGVMCSQQLSGIGAVLGYMQNIFDAAGSSIPSVYSVILVGCIQLISNIVSGQLVDKVGRKILLIISHICMTLASLSLGVYFYLKASDVNVERISWLPIASLMTYVTAFYLGLANIPWVLLAELFSPDLKILASTITSFFVLFLSFLIVMWFPYLAEVVGMAGSFFIFASVLSVGLAFSVILVPETKGRSNGEIQNILIGVRK